MTFRWQAQYRCACSSCADRVDWSDMGMPKRRWRWLARLDAWRFLRNVRNQIAETRIASVLK